MSKYNVIGSGNDKEPLLKNVTIVEEFDKSKQELTEYVIESLNEIFKNAKYVVTEIETLNENNLLVTVISCH